jgi:hypothetical protein
MLIASEHAPGPGKSDDAGTHISRRNSIRPAYERLDADHSAAEARQTKRRRLAAWNGEPNHLTRHTLQNGFRIPPRSALGGFLFPASQRRHCRHAINYGAIGWINRVRGSSFPASSQDTSGCDCD